MQKVKSDWTWYILIYLGYFLQNPYLKSSSHVVNHQPSQLLAFYVKHLVKTGRVIH